MKSLSGPRLKLFYFSSLTSYIYIAYTCHNNKLFKETMLHPRGNLYRFAVQGYILQVAQSLGFDLEVKSF